MVYGLNYYRQSLADAKNEAAVKVEQVLTEIKLGKLDQAEKLVIDLQNDNQGSSFPVVATLALAKQYFNTKDYNKAIIQYNWLIDSVNNTDIKDIARLRKARAQVNNQQIDEALTTISSVENRANLAEAILLKGDILLSNKQYDKAKEAYASVEKNSETNISAETLKQRIELVNIKQQANGSK